MKPRFFVLLALLISVAAASVWREMNPRQSRSPLDQNTVRSAPVFQLLDQKSRPIQLAGYLNRYRVLLYFFDARLGPDADPVLQQLKTAYPTLKSSGIMVFAISSPLGPDHKATAAAYPFPVLRDTQAGQPGSCSAVWGRAKANPGEMQPAVVEPAAFLIEANGTVRWNGDFPIPVENPRTLISSLVGED